MSLGQLVYDISKGCLTLGWRSSTSTSRFSQAALTALKIDSHSSQVTQLSPQSYQPSERTGFERGFFTNNQKKLSPKASYFWASQGVRVVGVVQFPASQTLLPLKISSLQWTHICSWQEILRFCVTCFSLSAFCHFAILSVSSLHPIAGCSQPSVRVKNPYYPRRFQPWTSGGGEGSTLKMVSHTSL